MREQQPVPVDKSVAAVASAAFKAYSEAVEESQEHSVSSVGEYLRKRFQQVGHYHPSSRPLCIDAIRHNDICDGCAAARQAGE